jgi:hypothetical protein
MEASAQDRSDNVKRPTGRRAVLAGTAAGMVAAVGAGAALAGFDAAPANAATGTAGPGRVIDAKAFGAVGDGTTNDTTALGEWIDAINQAPGEVAFLPPGRYMIDAPLPEVTVASVIILGCGWSYSATPVGSVIAALPTYSVPSSSSPAMLSLAGNGNRLDGICVDGVGIAPTVISVTGARARQGSPPPAACARETTPGSAPASMRRRALRRSAAATWSRPTGPPTRPSPTSKRIKAHHARGPWPGRGKTRVSYSVPAASASAMRS